MRHTLHTSVNAFDEVHRISDRVKAKSKSVTIPHQTLKNLLMDHSILVSELQKCGVEVKVKTERKKLKRKRLLS